MAGQLRVDEITDELGTGSPSFPNGVDATELTGDIVAARITDALNASGSAPIYACRAWVNFDGTTSPGTIRASGNVSSVARNATGDYTVNFTTAMPDENYSTSVDGNRSAAAQTNCATRGGGTYSSTAVQISTFTGTGASAANADICSVSIFR
jgi:hypothetical protein